MPWVEVTTAAPLLGQVVVTTARVKIGRLPAVNTSMMQKQIGSAMKKMKKIIPKMRARTSRPIFAPIPITEREE